jgi:hypothetical protein
MIPNKFPIIPDYLLIQIKADLAQRKKIDAIKHLRQITNMGLGEAKEFVEAIDSGLYGNIIDNNTEDTLDSLQNKLLLLENQSESLERRIEKSNSSWLRMLGDDVSFLETSLHLVKLEIAKIKGYLKKMGIVDEQNATKEIDEKHSITIHNYGTMNNPNIQNDGSQYLQSNENNAFSHSTKQEQISELLSKLSEEIKNLHNHSLSDETITQVKQDFDVLNTELKSKSPRKKWYELSIDELINAAKNLGEIGKPILAIATQILLLLK